VTAFSNAVEQARREVQQAANPAAPNPKNLFQGEPNRHRVGNQLLEYNWGEIDVDWEKGVEGQIRDRQSAVRIKTADRLSFRRRNINNVKLFVVIFQGS
jgi:hypothetical protein